MEKITPLSRLEEAIAEYFRGEEKGGIVLIAWAFFGLATAAYLFFSDFGPFETGLLYPVFLMALVQLLKGGHSFFKAKKWKAKLKAGMQQAPSAAVAEEQARVARLKQNYGKYQQIEMLLFLLGFALVVGGAFGGMGAFCLGTGIGLTLQAAFSLVFSLFAGYRTGFYHYELNVFRKQNP